MGFDPFCAISLAQINVLCVPAGKITALKFEEYIRALRAFSVIALRNVTSTSSLDSYREGYVLLKVGGDLYQTSSTENVLSDFNVKPQIVIGLVDGEHLTVTSKEDFQQRLKSILSNLQQYATSLNETAVCAVVVLGGDQIPISDGLYFVDLDGNGPSISDVVQQIVVRLQSYSGGVITNMKKQLSRSVTTEDGLQSSAHVANQASEAMSPPNRVDNPATESDPINSHGNERNNTLAKTSILLGQLSLQVGQWPEAMRYFSEGAAIARDNINHLWHGRALEGLLVCMVLFVWANIDFNIPRICYPTNERKGPSYNSQSMGAICAANRSTLDSTSIGKSASSSHTLTVLIPHLLSIIISLQERAAGIFQDEEHFEILCQSLVRWGNLLLAVKKCGGTLNDATIQHIVDGNNANSLANKEPSTMRLFLPVKALTKIFVDAALEAKSRLSVRKAAPIQTATVLSLAMLGVERKQAFYLREFLQSLGPTLIEARRIGAAEVGVHPSASLPPLLSLGHVSKGVSKPGLHSLLESVCEIYGLSKTAVRSTEQQISLKDQLQDALAAWQTAHQAGDIMIKLDILSLCIEVSDAVPDLECSLNLTSTLLQVSLGRVTLQVGSLNPAPLIASSDQSRLLLNIQKAVGLCARYGLPNTRAKYWDKCLVRFVELSEESNSNRLIPRTARDLPLATIAESELGKDPFIFNPFAKAIAGAGQHVIVVGEQTKFNVLLQNPLQVDVEIEDIMLRAEGCEFEPDHHNIVLGPLCSQVFTLTGKALRSGDLIISGCTATIRGCYKEDFVIVQGNWKPPRATKSLASRSSLVFPSDIQLPEISQVSLKVTAALPKLSMASSSLMQQSLMVLEGEKTTFTLTLQNSSDLDIDLVLFSFEDSVSRRLQEALSNKDLLPADLYEIQNQIASRPVLRLVENEQTDKVGIPKRAEISFTFELFGRPGLNDVTILVDYAYLGKPKDEIQEPFFTRQLRHTISTTINGSIDIPRCAVLPLQGNLLSTYTRLSNLEKHDMQVGNLKSSTNESIYCMLLLDVRNIWPQPLEVEILSVQLPETNGENDQFAHHFSVTETLQPGQMTRLLLLAPRILITDPYTPIPSLDTKRQFIVSASRMTIEAEAASRESFWYRERLLSCLQGTWKEQNGLRKGRIDMRKGIRLSSRMIDALRKDLVEIVFSLNAVESTISEQSANAISIKQVGDSHFRLQRNSFACLTTRVYNQSTEELRLLLRVQPSLRHQPHNVALDLSKRFAWTGTLQRALHPPLKPLESREIELGIIALSEGEYEINGMAEEIKTRSSRTETTIAGPGNSSERRIWHARKPCLIDAVEQRL